MSFARFGALAAVLSLSGCINLHRATSEQTLREAWQPGTAIAVDTRCGDVEVTVDPSLSDVAVDARRTAGGNSDAEARSRVEQVRVVAARDGAGHLTFTATFPGGAQNGDGCAFSIRTPAIAGLTVTTGNGDVRADGCGGDADLHTSNGRITVHGQGGGVTGSTSNGDVDIASAGGPVAVTTSNGRIEVRDVAFAVEARSSNGRILFEPLADHRQPYTLTTSNGDIVIALRGDPAGRLRASTSAGRVNVRSARIAIDEQGGHDDRTIVIGGATSPDSHATTSNGNIDLSID